MNNFSAFQTLILNEEKERICIEFKKGSAVENVLQDLQKLLDYLEDYSLTGVIIFRNLDCLNSCLNSIDEFRHWEKMLERLNRLPIISIAIIDGSCFGVSLQLAMTCDFRLASTISTLQSTEVKQGYLPGMIIFRLAKSVGLGVAKRILFMGLTYNAKEALQIGLIDKYFSSDDEKTVLDEFIRLLLPIQPITIQLTRRLLDESFANSYEETIGNFFAAQHRCMNILQKNNPLLK